MALTPEQATELIRKRRAIYPKSYHERPVTREVVEEILENANWAPTHRLTEPWRFKVFHSEEALQGLSNYLGDFYEKNTPPNQYSALKHEKAKENPLKSACVIAICMKRDPEERIPAWEEIAAVACAVQNMWLTCTAHGIGSYWSTPKAALEADQFLCLEAGESCLGLFYMGYHDLPELPGKRSPFGEKIQWM